MVEEVRPGFEDEVGAALHDAAEVGHEDLDGAAGDLLAEEADGLGEDRRAAVLPLVAVDGGDDDMLDAHQPGSLGHAARLVPVEVGGGAASLDGAEAARARADVAQDHERGRAGSPALAHVRAARALADGVQVVGLDDLGDLPERLAVGELDAEPLGPLPWPVRRDGFLDDGEFEEAVGGAVAPGGRGGFESDLAGAARRRRAGVSHRWGPR